MIWLLYAALSAVCFGMRGILYHWTSQKPIERSLLLLGVYLSGAIISLLFALTFHDRWNAPVWTGLSMGLFSFISNAAMFRAFAVGKASLVAIFTALTPVVVVAGSFGLWGETLNLPQTAAFVVIVAGIVMIRYSNDISLTNLKGAQWALLAMVTFGITDISSKQAMLWGADKLATLFVMYATGSLLFLVSWLRTLTVAKRSLQREIAAALEVGDGAGAIAGPAVAGVKAAATEDDSASVGLQTTSVADDTASVGLQTIAVADETMSVGMQTTLAADGTASVGMQTTLAADGTANARLSAPRWTFGKTLAVGMAVGISNISGMVLILPAFELGVTGLVSAVIATNVLLILVYARFVLKEVWSLLEFVGILTAIAGVLILRLLG